MTNFRIVVELKDVAVGDAEVMAQDIFDTHAPTLDPGDLTVSISRSQGSDWFDTGFEPNEE